MAIAGASAAIPIVGAAVAAVTIALSLLFSGKSGAQKVASTHIVDDLELNPQYGTKANLAAYLAGPRTRTSQKVALANFDAVWVHLISTSGCGNFDQLGDAGHNCISDRDRGGKWDWFALYRDPIANDPQAKDDPAGAAIFAAIPGLTPADVSLIEKFWFPGLLLLLAVLL